jgi:hypothetical protein
MWIEFTGGAQVITGLLEINGIGHIPDTGRSGGLHKDAPAVLFYTSALSM